MKSFFKGNVYITCKLQGWLEIYRWIIQNCDFCYRTISQKAISEYWIF